MRIPVDSQRAIDKLQTLMSFLPDRLEKEKKYADRKFKEKKFVEAGRCYANIAQELLIPYVQTTQRVQPYYQCVEIYLLISQINCLLKLFDQTPDNIIAYEQNMQKIQAIQELREQCQQKLRKIYDPDFNQIMLALQEVLVSQGEGFWYLCAVANKYYAHALAKMEYAMIGLTQWRGQRPPPRVIYLILGDNALSYILPTGIRGCISKADCEQHFIWPLSSSTVISQSMKKSIVDYLRQAGLLRRMDVQQLQNQYDCLQEANIAYSNLNNFEESLVIQAQQAKCLEASGKIIFDLGLTATVPASKEKYLLQAIDYYKQSLSLYAQTLAYCQNALKYRTLTGTVNEVIAKTLLVYDALLKLPNISPQYREQMIQFNETVRTEYNIETLMEPTDIVYKYPRKRKNSENLVEITQISKRFCTFQQRNSEGSSNVENSQTTQCYPSLNPG